MINSRIKFINVPEFELESGEKLFNIKVAYQTHGKLNGKKDNAILVFHALSGSAHIAGENKSFSKQNQFWTEDNYSGWWDSFVGEGKIVDTHKYFVICQNVLGGCYGTTGPSSVNSATNRPYGSEFSDLEISDMVRLQKIVLDKLEVNKLYCVIGSSLGGFMALEYCFLFGETVEKVVAVCCSAKISNLTKLQGFEQIIAIENDSNYNGGDYYSLDAPDKGLMLARIIAAKTYVDIDTIAERARKETTLPNDYFYDYRFRHNIESYVFHQGQKFVKRFDANSYLKIVKAIQGFDLAKKFGDGSLKKSFEKLKNNNTSYLVASISTDYCYYPEEQEAIFEAMRVNGLNCRYELVDSMKGHDSFLLEPEKYFFIKNFLEKEALKTVFATKKPAQKRKNNFP